MKKIIITAALLASIMLSGCGNNHNASQSGYKVTCRLNNTAQHDSATLLVLEKEYHQLRVCGKTKITDGTLTFSGQTNEPKVALIRWDNDTVQPFYFVLHEGDINITINPGSWDITGSPLNSEYLHYINMRNDINDKRVTLWQEYIKLSSEKSLKRSDEARLVSRDSLLNDSLQRITVDRINRGDAVGEIIRERYGNQLDQEHKRMVN